MCWVVPMPEPESKAEMSFRDQEIKRISAALHNLCQPLTTLQCRLEMAELIDTPEACRQAVVAGLVECARMAAAVTLMRQALRAAMRQTDGDQEIGAAA
jgi:hypothetical protein